MDWPLFAVTFVVELMAGFICISIFYRRERRKQAERDRILRIALYAMYEYWTAAAPEGEKP